MDDFLQKLKNVVRIVLYGLAISQSNCRKAGPYQLPCNNNENKTINQENLMNFVAVAIVSVVVLGHPFNKRVVF